MGKQFHIETRTMKFLVVLALVAAAYAAPEAEADPAYFYGNYYGYPSYYSGYGYRSYASPYWGGYYNRGYGYWKRDADSQPEAEAEAKADPTYWYGNYWGAQPAYYGGYRSYTSPYWGGYYNRGYGYWKRDADSKPEAKAEAKADPAY